MSKKLDPLIVGNAGLYLTCYHLSRLGWNVMPTARNARGIDIVAYDRGGTDFLGIQVKTLSKADPVPLGTSIENLMGDFWVVVNRLATDPTSYILEPGEVEKLAHRGGTEGSYSYWLQPREYGADEFREAWDRIGRGDDPESPA
jgi:hypothetical protein